METHQDKHAYVKVGDVVTLFCDQANGWMTSGDLVVGYGLWVPKLKEKMAVPPHIRETRMQIVPKLYYSSRKAYMKERTVRFCAWLPPILCARACSHFSFLASCRLPALSAFDNTCSLTILYCCLTDPGRQQRIQQQEAATAPECRRRGRKAKPSRV
jgi:hypothetical protein